MYVCGYCMEKLHCRDEHLGDNLRTFSTGAHMAQKHCANLLTIEKAAQNYSARVLTQTLVNAVSLSAQEIEDICILLILEASLGGGGENPGKRLRL